MNYISCVFWVLQICFMIASFGVCQQSNDITYKLFTRSNPTRYQIIPIGNKEKFRRSYFNPRKPTIIYLMGFSESTTGESTMTLKKAFLSSGDYNFISVDWSHLIQFPWYFTAVRNTRIMGANLAEFIQFLRSARVLPSSIHIIGFSLGAEAAGFAGKELKSRGIMVSRITGLDPAYPGFMYTQKKYHLAKGDAMFVDIVHTNPGTFGFLSALGDVDFYVNPGSQIQPGCDDEVLPDACSHSRAWQLYAKSVTNPTGFPASRCARRTRWGKCRSRRKGYMGYAAEPRMSGKMYLYTNWSPPFSQF